MIEKTVMVLWRPVSGLVESSAWLPSPTPERPPRKRGFTAEELGQTLRSQVCLDDISTVPLHRAKLVGFCPAMEQVDSLLRKVVGLDH